MVYCRKSDVIVKCCFSWADVWSYAAESTDDGFKVVHSERKKNEKGMRIGIAAFGSLSVLWLFTVDVKQQYNSFMVANCILQPCPHKLLIFVSQVAFYCSTASS